MDGCLNYADAYFLDAAQKIQDNYADATRLAVFMVNGNDEAVTRISRCSNYYRVILKTGKGAECYQSNIRGLCLESRQTGQTTVATCPYTGLLQACVPLVMHGEYQGGWIVGQARQTDDEKPFEYYEALMRTLSYEIGVHAYPLRKLMYELPAFSLPEFTAAHKLLETLAGTALQQTYLHVESMKKSG